MVASVLFDGLGLVALVVLLGAAVAAIGLVSYRLAMRRWRLIRNHVLTKGALATWEGVRLARHRRSTRRGAGGWTPAKARREIWWAVDGADRALAHALETGAAVADLPSLNRRLHRAAEELDQRLAVHPGAAPVGPQVDQLLTAAADLRLAAVESAGDAAAPLLAALVDDARREFHAMAEGMARSRATGPLRS